MRLHLGPVAAIVFACFGAQMLALYRTELARRLVSLGGGRKRPGSWLAARLGFA